VSGGCCPAPRSSTWNPTGKQNWVKKAYEIPLEQI